MSNFEQIGVAQPLGSAPTEVLRPLGDSSEITPELAQSFYQELNQLHFEGRLPACKIEISRRLTATAGKIWPKQRLIRLSLAYYKQHGVIELMNTILHEMVHLWLHEQGLPSGHTPHFRQKLKEVGMPDRIHALPMPSRAYKYIYRCPTCQREIRTRRRIHSSCGKCDKVYNPRHRLLLKQKL